MYIGKCPGKCHADGEKKVYGVAIHASESSVCKSAIYDHSMPITGGIIGIGI